MSSGTPSKLASTPEQEEPGHIHPGVQQSSVQDRGGRFSAMLGAPPLKVCESALGKKLPRKKETLDGESRAPQNPVAGIFLLRNPKYLARQVVTGSRS